MLSIEATTKLLKLHLQWPERKDWNGKEDQALEFYKWLFINHYDRPEVMQLDNVEFVAEFLKKNKHILWPTIKEEEKWANLRLEPRIENDVSVEMTVTECEDSDKVGASASGRTLDLGLHGMRVTLNKQVPAGAKVRLIVTKDDNSEKSFELVGELRWVTDLEDGYLVGIRLEETEEFKTWQQAFGAEFVAPVLGRNA